MPEIISGKYVTVTPKQHHGKTGAVLSFINPDSKVNTVPPEALQEMIHVLDDLAEDSGLSFLVFTGATEKIHAGADVKRFQGDIDLATVEHYMMLGARLDFTIKTLSQKIKTVSILQGERFGGSVEWPLMTRWSVCTPDTAIQLSEVTIGIIPGWSGILNVMLRSNPHNARYMAATGNRVTAQEMKECGLVEVVAENNILEAALDLATQDKVPEDPHGLAMCSRDELDTIISERTDSRRYQELKKEVLSKLQANALSDNKDRDDYAGKYIQQELRRLGKPLAPLAVAAGMALVDQYSDINWNSLDRIKAMGEQEARACCELMKTMDRKTGVNAVLTSNPVEKIPIYLGQ